MVSIMQDILAHNGQTKTIAECAKELGRKYETLRHRKSIGWSDEKILTEPLLS